MFRTALRNVLAHKLRLLMTMLAVVLGVAFVAGTLIFTATLDKGLRDSSAKSFSNISVAVRADGTGGSVPSVATGDDKPKGIDRATYRKLAALDGVAAAQPLVSGYTGVADAHHDLIGTSWSNTGGNFAPGKDGRDPRYTFSEGRGPRAAGEVALDKQTAEKGGYRVGDTVDLSINGPVRHEKLTGVFTTDDGVVSSGGTLTLFDTATAQRLFLSPGHYSEVDLTAASGTSEQTLLAEAEKVIDGKSEISAVTGQKLTDDQAKAIASQTSSMNTVFLAFAGVALFVGIFLIANTFTMLVAQRTRELALLRAVGASRRQVTRSVLIEATFVGLLSAVVGFAAGVGLAFGMRSLINSNSGGSLPSNPLVITPSSAVVALLVGVLITVLSAWLPARRAAKIPPVAAMSSTDTPPKQRSLIVRNIIGALLAAAGVMIIVLGINIDGNADAGASVIGLGAAVLLIGVIVLTPLLSRPVIALFAPVLAGFGIAGRLARKNSLRNPRRTAATATALMIGLTLMSALGVITTSMKSSIASAATDGIRANYAVQMSNFGELDHSVVDSIKGVSGVSAVSGQTSEYVHLGAKGTTVDVSDTTKTRELFNLEKVSGRLSGLGTSGIAVDDETARKNGWKQGQSLTMTLPDDKKHQVRIVGVYRHSEMSPSVQADQRLILPHQYPGSGWQSVYVKAAPGQAGQHLQDAIKAKLGNSPIIEVQTKDDLLKTFNQSLDQVLYMVYGLLGMSVVVAVIGVVNTMAMSVFERAREIGMLRAIGLERGRVKRMVRLESLVISVFGALLGLVMGTFLAWAAGQLIVSSFKQYAMELPWGQYGIFFAAAIVVGVLAAVWPARRAARLNALEAIKTT